MTTAYFNGLTENVFDFNMETFVSKQGTIYNKFTPKGTYVEIIDKYLFQTIEEIHEVKQETDKEEQAKEIIDVMMYLGSTIYSLVNFPEIKRSIIIAKTEPMDVNSTMDEVFESLMHIRRMYPERKWHKVVNKDLIIKDRNKIAVQIIFSLIEKLASLLVSNHFYVKVNNMIVRKQIFIEELKETKK